MSVSLEGLENTTGGFCDWIDRMKDNNQLSHKFIINMNIASTFMNIAVEYRELTIPQSFEHVLRLLLEQEDALDRLPDTIDDLPGDMNI